jgi:hypothetical protein
MLAHLMTVLVVLLGLVAGLALLTRRVRPTAAGPVRSDVGDPPGNE